jgi:hypothetical protein
MSSILNVTEAKAKFSEAVEQVSQSAATIFTRIRR